MHSHLQIGEVYAVEAGHALVNLAFDLFDLHRQRGGCFVRGLEKLRVRVAVAGRFAREAGFVQQPRFFQAVAAARLRRRSRPF